MQRVVLAILGAALVVTIPAAAPAQSVPEPMLQEVLIKTSLLTFNDANLTGNYTVLHARMSKPVRDQNSPDKLKQVFKSFVDQHIDISIIAAKPPIATTPAQIDKRGVLQLRGYFDTKPARVRYELDYIQSDGEWKILGLGVRVKSDEPASN
jgi:hypothetical protein